jgi:hypothetical protein
MRSAVFNNPNRYVNVRIVAKHASRALKAMNGARINRIGSEFGKFISNLHSIASSNLREFFPWQLVR